MHKQPNSYTLAIESQAVASTHETGTTRISWATALALYNRLLTLALPAWMAESFTLRTERELKQTLLFLSVVISLFIMAGLCETILTQEGGAL